MEACNDIYVYKLSVDNGGAPCVHRGLLSLAICKPKIRKSAAVGALVVGFSGKADGERLIYIAKVTRKEVSTDYYRKGEYTGRPDRIYRVNDGKAELRAGARYHSDRSGLHRDVGPLFENAYVLLSDDFRYFGARGTDEYKTGCRTLARLVENLTQGHRRYHSVAARRDLELLWREVWANNKRKTLGKPTELATGQCCNDDVPCRIC